MYYMYVLKQLQLCVLNTTSLVNGHLISYLFIKAYKYYFIGGIRPPCKVTRQVVISSTQLSINIRKRGSWGNNDHQLGIVFYYRGSK